MTVFYVLLLKEQTIIQFHFLFTVISVSPSAHRNARLVEDNGEPTIIFDNGQTFHCGVTDIPSEPQQALPPPPTTPAPVN